MMHRKIKILSWMVVLLMATNISTIISVFYYSRANEKTSGIEKKVEVPGDRRTQFFRNELGLEESQMDDFRNANRKFNRTARVITMELDELRQQMVDEMTQIEADEKKLADISKAIGEQHEQLKVATYTFFLEMAALCDEVQKKKLNELFKSFTDSDDNVNLPQRRSGRLH